MVYTSVYACICGVTGKYSDRLLQGQHREHKYYERVLSDDDHRWWPLRRHGWVEFVKNIKPGVNVFIPVKWPCVAIVCPCDPLFRRHLTDLTSWFVAYVFLPHHFHFICQLANVRHSPTGITARAHCTGCHITVRPVATASDGHGAEPDLPFLPFSTSPSVLYNPFVSVYSVFALCFSV